MKAITFAAVLGAFLLSTSASQAVAQRKGAPPKGKSAPIQAKGIVNDVVDGLWVEVDRYFHDGDYTRVVVLCRVCVEADPSFDEAYSSAGYLLWSMGDNASANALLEYGIKHSTQPGSLNNEMGQQLFRLKRYEDAIPYLKKAVSLGGVPPTAYSTLGHSYTKLGKFEDAVQTWKQVVAKFPSFPSGPKNLKDAEERLKAGK
jgi:tetratricopeptide (TPR) repeat protein